MTPFDTNAARSIQVYRAAKPRVLFLVRYFQPCSSPSCLLTLFRCPSSLLVPSLLLTPHSIPSEFWRVSSLLFLTFLAILVFLRSPAPPPSVIQNFSPTPLCSADAGVTIYSRLRCPNHFPPALFSFVPGFQCRHSAHYGPRHRTYSIPTALLFTSPRPPPD